MKSSVSLLMILLFAGCSVLKNTRKTTEENVQSTEMEARDQTLAELRSIKDSQQLTVWSDDARSDYAMRLWPKGKLQFLPDGGITGEFDSVQLKGSLHKISTATENMNTIESNEQKNGNLSEKKETKSSRKNDNTKISSPDSYTVFIVIFVLVCGVVVYSYIKKYL